MQSLLDQVFPTPGSSIRSMAGAGFPVLNVGNARHRRDPGPGTGAEPGQARSPWTAACWLAGERASDLPNQGERASVYANERFSGRFRRVVSLPEDADPARVDASYRDGVLRISVARRESRCRAASK